MILGPMDPGPTKYQTVRGIGEGILALDCYDNDDFDCACDVARMRIHRTLPNGSGEREMLKFYSKRLSCSCLKEKYKHTRKTLPKIGQCWQCKQEKERASFVTCGRCKVPLYCSRGCQVADWLDHENDCDTCVAARKRQMAQAIENNAENEKGIKN